jgi:hypothetical protein
MKTKQNQIDERAEQFRVRAELYDQWKELIGPRPLSELRQLVESFVSDAESVKEENRLLRIGIIGQIKRGKSTMLNALFFDGEDILPKAITPMTAALTAIKYAEKPRAVIHFYEKTDWEVVCRKAKACEDLIAEKRLAAEKKPKEKGIRDRFSKPKENIAPVISLESLMADIPEELKAFKEIYDLAKPLAGELDQYLGKSKEITDITDLKALTGKLFDYVGAKGKLTPLVKSTEIYVNIPAIKDLEIVDTPGLNDPILSRAARTKEYMGKCDVVFLLSSCAQFLPAEDMRLLRQNIPSKGIRDIVLVGTRFDESLLQTNENYDDIISQLTTETEKLGREAWRNVERVKAEIGSEELLVKVMESAMPPIFVSAMGYQLARHLKNLNPDEAHILKRLNQMYDNFTFDEESLMQIANLEPIHEKIAHYREKKDEIMKGRFANMLQASESAFREGLQHIHKTMAHQYEQFMTEDIEAIANKQKQIVKRIKSGQTRVEGVFERNIIEAERKFTDIRHTLRTEVTHAKRLSTMQGSESHSYEVSDSKWWNPFSWGSSHTEHYTTHYECANVHEAIEHLEDFVINAENILIEDIKTIVDLKKFRGDILMNIKDMFDTADDSFNPQDVLIPVENAVSRITIPDIKLDLDKHITTIRSKFNSSQVRDSEIATLRNEQARIADLILQELIAEITRLTQDIASRLTGIKDKFIPELIGDLEETVVKLRAQLEEKEAYKEKYESLLDHLREDIH